MTTSAKAFAKNEFMILERETFEQNNEIVWETENKSEKKKKWIAGVRIFSNRPLRAQVFHWQLAGLIVHAS